MSVLFLGDVVTIEGAYRYRSTNSFGAGPKGNRGVVTALDQPGEDPVHVQLETNHPSGIAVKAQYGQVKKIRKEST